MRFLGPREAAEETDDERIGFAKPAICPIDGCGADPDEHLIDLGRRLLNVCELQHLRRAVLFVDNCSHQGTRFGGRGRERRGCICVNT